MQVDLTGKTLPELLLGRARTEPDQVPVREKWQGIYQGYSWADYLSEVSRLALGLAALGLKKGDRVAIMGDACVEWLFLDVAVMSIGGISVGVYPTSAPEEVKYVLAHSGATIFVAETQEHLDKLLPVLDDLPEIRHIVVIDTRALFLYEHAKMSTYDQLLKVGEQEAAAKPTQFEALAGQVQAEDPALMVYTSGTTGLPKGVVHTHRSLLYSADSYATVCPQLREGSHRTVIHLPLAHIVARAVAVGLPLITRLTIFLGEDVESFAETVREVGPTYYVVPPRFYQKIASQLVVGINTSTWLKRKAYAAGMAASRRTLDLRWAGKPVPAWLRLLHWVARVFVFTPLLDKVGFPYLRYPFTGSAPMPAEVMTLWQLWGLNLREVYGQTETGGLPIAHLHDWPKSGTIGRPLARPGWEVKLSEEGEILHRGPMNFSGYWHNDEATQRSMQDGWVHTGDVAEITASGQIRLVDRKSDIMITVGGKNISPQQVENVLKESPYVGEAIVIADGRKYVTALLELDFDTVSEWARLRQIPYTSYTTLVQTGEVQALIEAEVAGRNQRLARVEQVKRFRIIPMELDPEKGETTPTRKIKRKQMYAMFHELIESMYSDADLELIGEEVRTG